MIIFLAAFIILLCISAPITVALGGCSLVYALVGGNVPVTTLIQTTFGGLSSFQTLITDSLADPKFTRLLKRRGIQVMLA